MNRLKRLANLPAVQVVAALFLQALTGMFFALLTARWLGPSDRGTIVLAATSGTLLMLAGGLGTPTGARIKVGNQNSSWPVADLIASIRPLVALHFATSAIAGLFIFNNTPERALVLVAFVPYAVLMFTAYVLRELLHGLGRHQLAVAGDLATVALQVVAATVLRSFGALNLGSILVVLVASYGLQCALLWFPLKQRHSHGQRRTRTLVKFSVPALALAVGQSFALRGDRLLLGLLTSNAVVGVYGSAATLSESLTLISAGVGQVLFRQSSQRPGLDSGNSRRATMAITTVAAAALALCASLMVDLLLGGAYADGIPWLQVLALSTIPLASYQMDIAILSGGSMLRQAGLSTIAGALVLLLGCTFLAPSFGGAGAAWSSVAAYSVMALTARCFVLRARARGQ